MPGFHHSFSYQPHGKRIPISENSNRIPGTLDNLSHMPNSEVFIISREMEVSDWSGDGHRPRPDSRTRVKSTLRLLGMDVNRVTIVKRIENGY